MRTLPVRKIKLPSSGEETINIDINQDEEYRYIFLGKGKNKLRLEVNALHKVPNVNSRVEIRAVVMEQAEFDFEGILKIFPGAKNTNTYLKVDCLLLGKEAKARAVPSLEIEEDNVQAGHGATVGAIDDEILNYLSSKGLNKNESEQLIIENFLGSS